MAIKFNLKNFPKYREEHQDDDFITWAGSLQNNGYPSSKSIGIWETKSIRMWEIDVWEFEMDDFEYTHFVLKWS